MNKLISRRGIILIIIPLFVVFLQGFLRFVLKHDFNTLGITLGALGLGQMLPFFYFDHFIANKVLAVAPSYKMNTDELQISYKVKGNVNPEEIDKVKNWFIIAMFVSLALFLITIYLGLSGEIEWHVFFGGLSCIISWILLVFKW
ncbi:hypothetical protein [Lacibacter sediminis]|uniref:Uncharacterized protein n=1 Tax=Lacibacter sediminis TaxID=2760713 RepID=A0A7G5XB24_9BACT|nr:hypothetical protein [Lacibacter sediminis]QNA42677.1 hypothetical protein H4075_11210 [Lacibacter sediminis]